MTLTRRIDLESSDSTQQSTPKGRTTVPGSPALYWGLLTGAVFAGIVPIYTATRLPALTTAGPLAALVVLIYSGLRLAGLAGGSAARPLALTFWAFVYIWLALAPLAQESTGIRPLTVTSNYERDFATAEYIYLASLIIFDAAYVFGRSRKLSGHLPIQSTNVGKLWEISLPRLYIATALAILSGGYLAYRVGIITFFDNRSAVNELTLSHSGGQASSAIDRGLGQVLPLITLLAWTPLVWSSRSRRGGTRPPFGLSAWMLLAAINLVVNNPIGNSRQWAGTVLAGFVLSQRWITPRTFRALVPLIVGILSVVFPYLDYFRGNDGSFNVTQGRGLDVFYAMSVKDYDAHAQFVNTLSYVRSLGFDLGHQLLGVVFFFIPHSIWPSRAGDTGVLLGQWIGSRTTVNLSEPLWGELLLAGGVPLVFAGFGFYGFALRRFDDKFIWSSRRTFHGFYSIFVPIAAGYQLIVLRGSLLQATGRGVLIFVVCALILRRVRQPQIRVGPTHEGDLLSPTSKRRTPKINWKRTPQVQAVKSQRLACP